MPTLSARHAAWARRTAVTLAVSAAGGSAAYLAGMPAPWVAGGLLVVAVASLLGLRTQIPVPMRGPAYLVLGLYSGSGVTPETLRQMQTWPGSFAILALSVVALTATSYWWLHRRAGWDRDTALLASLPGGLVFVMAVAERMPVDIKKVVLSHSIRVLALVELVPLLALVIGHSSALAASEHSSASRPLDLLILIASGGVLAMLLEKLRFPGGWILGGLLASASLLLTGAVEARLPAVLVVPAMVILAGVAGSRFRPGDLQILRAIAGPALAAFVITAGVSALSAALVTFLFRVSYIQALLAFAPGALDALIIIAFEMNADPAYVAAHHVARFFGLIIAVPLLARWLASHRPHGDGL